MTDYPVNMNIKPEVEPFFDEATNTISYIVKDPASNACAIVDSVMDIDYAAGRITYDSADETHRAHQANKG
jgi:glyoxylase-like metal-dependent hydrolase (beta-lactamase superfamily II)